MRHPTRSCRWAWAAWLAGAMASLASCKGSHGTDAKEGQRGAKPEIVEAPTSLAAGRAWVVEQQKRAEGEGRKVLLYVGAPWCEPCVRFHDAVVAGRLDRELAGVRLLELDHDQHETLLDSSDLDCRSKLIPLFAPPTPEGRCGRPRVEGGIKGDGAVGYLLPKVRALLDD